MMEMTTAQYRGAEWSAQFGNTLRHQVNAYFKEAGITVKGDTRQVLKVL